MAEENKAAENETVSAESGNQKLELSAFYGMKAGMTRIFDKEGNHVPVTVIKLIPNYIAQVKTKDVDGYEAYQLGYYQKRESLVGKPMLGKSKKAQLEKPVARLAEIKIDGVDPSALGKEVSLAGFKPASYIDATGTSKGKGFQGAMKRHNFGGGPASHGSHLHRSTGSIGQSATPGRVYKQKKMPGQMGANRKTVQNLMVVEVNEEKGYLLLKGAVPGPKNGFVKIAKALKKA